jgi:hypothetical protein
MLVKDLNNYYIEVVKTIKKYLFNIRTGKCFIGIKFKTRQILFLNKTITYIKYN